MSQMLNVPDDHILISVLPRVGPCKLSKAPHPLRLRLDVVMALSAALLAGVT